MRLKLALSNGSSTEVDFAGSLKEANLAYVDKPFREGDINSIVRQISYIPDDVDIRRMNVTACFIGDFGTAVIPCWLFQLCLAPYYVGQMGHQIDCTKPDMSELTRSFLYRPRVLLIDGIVHVPDYVLYVIESAEQPFREIKTSRLSMLDDANLDLIAGWCKEQELPHEFL